MNKIYHFLFVLVVIIIGYPTTTFTQIAEYKNHKVLSSTIIVKLKDENKGLFDTEKISDKSIKSLFDFIEVSEIVRKFPHSPVPTKKKNSNGKTLIDLSLIYELKYDANVQLEKVIHKLKNHPAIEYAEPHFLHQLLYEPDDIYNSNTYHYDTIKAFDAWDISKGSTDVVIGITDTGIEFGHEDLIDNLYHNEGEIPANNIDDDHDGYIDNYNGWDVGSGDNNPTWEVLPHGVYVTGLASATPDNGLGITGTGYYCRYMPVKISSVIGGSLVLNKSYEGMVYAADHGCSVINCSWGGTYYTDYGQDIVNYVTNNRNALVVAAAGNDDNSVFYYPASYENVLSVTATNEYDIRHSNNNPASPSGSNYNIHVDLCAPGVNTYSTSTNNGYTVIYFGTSFAAPVVAGCAGIVKSYFPDYTAQQVAEQLIATTDYIDDLSGNTQYSGLIGSGRVNLYKALTESSPSVKFIDISYSDGDDEVIETGDTVYIRGTFINYLSPVTGLSASVYSTSPYVEITDNQVGPGSLGQLETYNNNQEPFILKILPGAPFDASIQLLIYYNADNYYSKQYIEFKINNTITDFDINNISTSITTRGRFGYKYLSQEEGQGFKYKNSESLMFEGGLMIGNSGTSMINCFRNNSDFYPLSSQKPLVPSTVSDYCFVGKFSEYLFNLDITQYTHSWINEKDADYIIAEYEFANSSYENIDNFYTAIIADWDVLSASKNKIDYDEINRMSYTYYTESGIHVGIKLLSEGDVRHYAIDYVMGGAGGIDITSGFQEGAMYLAMTNLRHTAGGSGTGNDVVDVFGTGPVTIPSEDTLRVAFALIAGDNLFDLQSNAVSAQEKYDSIYFVGQKEISKFKPNLKIHPNPANELINVELFVENVKQVEICIFNILGEILYCIDNSELFQGNNTLNIPIDFLENGTYFIGAKTGDNKIVEKFVKMD